MLCVLPNVSSIVTDKERTATISLILDGVTKWKDLSSYPQFNEISFSPDPVIYPFKDVYSLKTALLEIEVRFLPYLLTWLKICFFPYLNPINRLHEVK